MRFYWYILCHRTFKCHFKAWVEHRPCFRILTELLSCHPPYVCQSLLRVNHSLNPSKWYRWIRLSVKPDVLLKKTLCMEGVETDTPKTIANSALPPTPWYISYFLILLLLFIAFEEMYTQGHQTQYLRLLLERICNVLANMFLNYACI